MTDSSESVFFAPARLLEDGGEDDWACVRRAHEAAAELRGQ
ncbi:hypothetical protein PEC18_31000 [Paucibacter sp. O1-1]|nr:hypothetical protein [Paucibacter sp. O1-1]MCU7375126.1 hypothetical protein [Paucibacter sp. O1-1]MDA3825217.1 hypothetical protein [Paucibacter sp. O1-1]MDA3830133.1 hypothetical protein [Paucibacter sp. O1-1]